MRIRRRYYRLGGRLPYNFTRLHLNQELHADVIRDEKSALPGDK